MSSILITNTNYVTMTPYSKIEKIAYERGYRVRRDGSLFSPYGNARNNLWQGYRVNAIRIDGKILRFKVHRLMAYQKYGDKIYEDGVVVRHLDGNRLNNSYENIAIGTQQDNCMDIPKEVRMRKALHATSFITKYTIEDVEVIRAYKQTHSYKETMQKFDISSQGTLWFILNKRRIDKTEL